MQAAERHNLATRVTSLLAQSNADFALNAFGAAVRARIETMFTAIDAAALAAAAPLLIVEILPGVDIIVARESSDASQVKNGTAPRLDAIWDRDDVTVEWVEPLTEVVLSVLRGAASAGAYYHQSDDQSHYFMFESKYRAEALKQFGVNGDEVQMVESPEEVV